MNTIKTDIPGVVIIEPKVFSDSRGYFFESFRDDFFIEKVCNTRFIQDNESLSSQGVLRGLHYQLPPYAQSKLVRVIDGEVYDVAVDIRKGSPTFGKYIGAILSGQNKHQFFIPRGFAHGFMVLSPTAIFSYKCDNYYHQPSERCIQYNDADLQIEWPIGNLVPSLSEKDLKGLMFKQADLFNYTEKLYE
jgi:dTDP-4-dehydrorhamnose 3,5-epimerase